MSNERCVMVTVADSDNVIVHDRSYDLIIERSRQMSTVPVEIYPNTVELRVIDNDASGKQIACISTTYFLLLIILLSFNIRCQFQHHQYPISLYSTRG